MPVPVEVERRVKDRGVWRRQVKPITSVLAILSMPIMLAVLTWAAKSFRPEPKVTEARFVADSAARDKGLRETDAQLLDVLKRVEGKVDRVDGRVSEFYCGRVSPSQRAGCR